MNQTDMWVMLHNEVAARFARGLNDEEVASMKYSHDIHKWAEAVVNEVADNDGKELSFDQMCLALIKQQREAELRVDMKIYVENGGFSG